MRIVFEFEAGDSLLTLEEFRQRSEAAYLKHVVGRFGNRSISALVLGISRKSLWERLRAAGLGSLSKEGDEKVADFTDELRRVTTAASIAA